MAVNIKMEDITRRVDEKPFSNESDMPQARGESTHKAENEVDTEELASKAKHNKRPFTAAVLFQSINLESSTNTSPTNVSNVLVTDYENMSKYSSNALEDEPAIHEISSTIEPENIPQTNTSLNSNDRHMPQPALAFTIEFDDNKQVDTAKYRNLFERYTARHKRHSSTSKVEVNQKKSSSLLLPNCLPKQKVPSTHSEGYFSSEDDTKRKADKLVDKLKQLGLKSLTKSASATESSDFVSRRCDSQRKEDWTTRSFEETPTYNKPSSENCSLQLESTSEKSSKPYWEPQNLKTINNLNNAHMNNYDGENNGKYYTKNIDCVSSDNMSQKNGDFNSTTATISEKISNIDSALNDYNMKNINERDCNLSSVSFTMDIDRGGTNSMSTNLDVFNVSNVDASSDGAISEAGTYTIHKDYTDEEKARMDIDKVFSVGILTEEEYNEPYVHSFKMSISRDNNTWISEWATQVAEHNSLPAVIGGTTGRTPPLSPSKIPSPICTKMQKMCRGRQEQGDSSIEGDSHLRIKERFGISPNQNTLIDSGGESDDDTSNSYNTPPHSSQRTPTHSAQFARRNSLSESLLRRMNGNENRRSVRKYSNVDNWKNDEPLSESCKTPSQLPTSRCLGRRSSSLDRKDYTSDTTESNTSRKSSLKYYPGDNVKHTNSPILSRLKCATPKLTNSPFASRKPLLTKTIETPTLEKTPNLVRSMSHAKNVGYFTCIENSPYMLRKSNSTTSYHETASSMEYAHKKIGILQNSQEFRHASNVQRSSSNASIRHMKSQCGVSGRSSFNNSDIDRKLDRGRFIPASDSSSEAGEQQTKPPAQHPLSSSIKFNRAFSVRRARLDCESDTTPNTTPEERRRGTQTEKKPAMSTSKQPNHHRSRTSSVGAYSKETLKRSDQFKTRTPSISRTDSGRFSMRNSKSPHHNSSTTQRSNQRPNKDQKKSTRSNSTLTSKEVEFQNWKRRKNYDPMKAAAEGRKKLVDTSRKQCSIENSPESYDNSVLRSASFHGTGGSLSVANDWTDNEMKFSHNDNHVPPPSSPQPDSDSDLETSSYLQTTENVVSAMSARITVYRPSMADSDVESDEDTSHSLHRSASKVHRVSDTESSDERQPIAQKPISNTKYNRAFSLRRARLEPQTVRITPSNITKKISQETWSKSESAGGIARTDSGRFSTRLNRSSNPGIRTKVKDVQKSTVPNAREVEMQNWKRRKSYDPMKAAMEGRKKATLLKKNSNASLSPSHVARSQSFHGSVGLGTSDWSDEELAASAEETPLY